MSTSEEKRPGSVMITAAAILLFALGLGLLAVSFAAQYRYVMTERHQGPASLIEAAALDVGMVIFSLLALGLARAGLPAKTERGLILACAAGSALMNYAAADVSSPRSVLAFCMPSVFLAIVADRVVVTVRRHVLGMRESVSPWAVAGRVGLYGLRFVLDPWETAKGVRDMVLAAAPLREATTETPAEQPQVTMAATPVADAPESAQPVTQAPAPSRPRTQQRAKTVTRNASAALRAKRHRMHKADDHSLCLAQNCPDATPAMVEFTPEPVGAVGSNGHAAVGGSGT